MAEIIHSVCGCFLDYQVTDRRASNAVVSSSMQTQENSHRPRKSVLLAYAPPASVPATKHALQVVIGFV